MNTNLSLQNKIDNAKELDFGDILSKTFELYKKTWLQGFILILLLALIIAVIFVPIYILIIEQVFDGSPNLNSIILLLEEKSESYRYVVLGLTFFISLITTGLMAGFYRIIKKIDFDESYSFIDFFYFYKAKNFSKIFALASFSLLVALINFAFEKFLPPTTAAVTNGILSIILSVYTTLFVVFFAFNSHLESSDFFTLSFKLGSKKWFLLFGLLFVTAIISMLGMIACFIGLFFTLSIVYLPFYLVYKDVFGFDNISELDEIGAE